MEGSGRELAQGAVTRPLCRERLGSKLVEKYEVT